MPSAPALHKMIVHKWNRVKRATPPPPYVPHSHAARASEAIAYSSGALIKAIDGNPAPWISWLARTSVVHHINELCAATNIEPLPNYAAPGSLQPPPSEPPQCTDISSDDSGGDASTATQPSPDHHTKYFTATLNRVLGHAPYPRPGAAFLTLLAQSLTSVNAHSVRTWLSTHRAMSISNHIPWILTQLGLPAPPALTPGELSATHLYFAVVLRHMLRTRPQASISYRYILYKILHTVMDDTPRRTTLLLNIRLPKVRTLLHLDTLHKEAFDAAGIDTSPTFPVMETADPVEQFLNPALDW